MTETFVLSAVGNEFVSDLNLAVRFLRKFTKNRIVAAVARTTDEVQADFVIPAKIPDALSNLEGSRYLKTNIHRVIGTLDGVYCYIDNDIHAVHIDAPLIFEFKKGLVAFPAISMFYVENYSEHALHHGNIVDALESKFGVKVCPRSKMWCGGMFLFDNNSTEFLDTWHQFTVSAFADPQWQKKDQATLIAAFWKHRLHNLETIPEDFHWLAIRGPGRGMTIKFMHFAGMNKLRVWREDLTLL